VKVAQAPGQGDSADDEVVRVVVERLKGQTDVGCADVANKAWNAGKTVLATKVGKYYLAWSFPKPDIFLQLLEHEPLASKQVPLLLNMKEDNLALIKAIDSGDPDLG
jgi:hypothetical protein